MRLKPLKFIAHKLGPFDHIELNWDKDSRSTLIVGENGMGKTTLVTAMAACLSFGYEDLFLAEYLKRFAHDKESFAYLELEINNQICWIFKLADDQIDKDHLNSTGPNTKIKNLFDPPLTNLPNWLRGDAGYVETFYEDDFSRIQTLCSNNLKTIMESLKPFSDIEILAAAYGVNRDIQHVKIHGHQDLDNHPLENILNPFVAIQSREILQWITNQHIYHALALSENKPDEAQAYLDAIQRVERLFSQDLEYPISFQVKRNPFRLEVKQNGTVLSVDQLSDGVRNLLSWPLDYLMRASRIHWADPVDSTTTPGLILVDEIDSHLHPEWQRRVMPVMAHLLPETYIMATTHSPFVVGAAADAQIFQIYTDDNNQVAVKAMTDQFYGYPADLVLEKAFVSSLYTPQIEQQLERLSALAAKVAAGSISAEEKQEHDRLLQELAQINPWLNNLLALAQMKEPLP